MLDEADESKDSRIGMHVVNVRRCALGFVDEDEEFEPPTGRYSKPQMQLYIKYIRTIQPKLTPQVHPSFLKKGEI